MIKNYYFIFLLVAVAAKIRIPGARAAKRGAAPQHWLSGCVLTLIDSTRVLAPLTQYLLLCSNA